MILRKVLFNIDKTWSIDFSDSTDCGIKTNGSYIYTRVNFNEFSSFPLWQFLEKKSRK